MLLPIRTDSPLRTTPYMNYALIAMNIVAFILQRKFRLEYGLMLDPSNLHWYQFVTYAFLHGDVIHILSNMLFLYIFGNNVCDKMGPVAYLGFYLGGAVFAGIALGTALR